MSKHTDASREYEVRLGILWRGNPNAERRATGETSRLRGLFQAVSALSVAAEPVAYSEGAEEEVRRQLLGLDGVLVWVDPLSFGRNRDRLGSFRLLRVLRVTTSSLRRSMT